MKATKIITGVLLASTFLWGANLTANAAEDETREVENDYQTCYNSDLFVTTEETEDVYEVYSFALGDNNNKLEWTATKTDAETAYTSRNVFARKTPNTEDKTELCLPAGTEIERVAISPNGWDIIKYEDQLYFMWYEYITDEQPVIAETPTYVVPQDSNAADTYEDYYDDIEPEQSSSPEGMRYLGGYELTAYEWTGNPCANGNYPTTGYTVASNTIPQGTTIYIEGLGQYVVEDTGGMAGNVIDIYMGDYDTCINFGRQYGDVYIVE